MALAELSQDEFAALTEAQELARDVLRDSELERRVLGLIFRRSAAQLLQGVKQVAGHALEQLLYSSALRLAEILGESGDAKSQVLVLREASQLPVDATFARDLAERAAKLASEQLGDAATAAALYQRALELAPESTDLLAALAGEFDTLGRLEELLVLRRRELSLTTSIARRLELRLDIARVMAEIEARGGRFGALRDNLRSRLGTRLRCRRSKAPCVSAARCSRFMTCSLHRPRSSRGSGMPPVRPSCGRTPHACRTRSCSIRTRHCSLTSASATSQRPTRRWMRSRASGWPATSTRRQCPGSLAVLNA